MIAVDEIRRAQETWSQAVVAGDAEAVKGLYGMDAVLKPTLSAQIRRTPAARAAYFEGSEETGDGGFLKANWKEARFFGEGTPVIRGDFATDVGKYAFVGQDGTETVADFTFVYEKVEGEIRIISHHSSLEYVSA